MMKRYLLFLLMCVCASVGAWATPAAIGSTQSTYEVTTTTNNKTVLTINLADANDLSKSGWDVQNGFGSNVPNDFKSADCVVINGPIGSDDAQLIQYFNYTLLNLYGATLASGVSGLSVYVQNTTAGIIVPQDMTAAQWLSGNSNPFQYKALFSIDQNSGTVTADIFSGDNNFATIMTDDRQDYHFFGNNNGSDNIGCSTLVINKIGKEYDGNSQPTGNYVESGVELTSDIINGINAANSDFTAINVENASASNISVVITNTHVNTLNLSGLNLSGEVTLDIGGDATNAANMQLQSLNLSDLTVKTVDASQVATLTNVNLAGANITSVDFTRTSGDYSNLNVTVSGPDFVGKFTPTAQIMWGNDEEAHVSKPAVVYSATDMHLHDGHVGITGDDSDFKNYVFWYQGDNDPTGIATLNAKGSIQATLLSEAYDRNKTFTKVKIDGYLTKAGLDDLSSVNATVLDLSDLDLTHEYACSIADISAQFCQTNWDLNPNVKFVILPEGATREQILSADKVSGLKNVYSLVSFTHDSNDKFDFTAYNRVSGTLAPALVAGGKGVVNSYMQYDGHNAYTPEMTPNNKKSATISGHINAYDLTAGEVNLDANGHLAFNKIYADESRVVDDRVNVGTVKPYGGLSGNTSGPETLDLKYAEIDGPQYINDIKISSLIHNYGPLKYLIIPETEIVKETPSYFITHNDIKEICIPSNIEVIRTHFAPSVDHIWTTGYKVGQAGGDPTELLYDNGCYETKADDIDPTKSPAKGYTNFNFTGLYPCGTYTFSSNLKMIETGAFSNTQPHVKDVYVLAVTAPECHVDAFNSAMYVGNTGYNPSIVDGVITRDSYVNGTSWITMLHYPRDCETPDVQRYTDPTRQYTVASNEVDGKGGVLYYPSHGEFLAAYAQGSTGYLWNAWERTYEWGMLKPTLSVGNDPWTLENQKEANAWFLKNPDLTKYPGDTKYTCTSFYDVTAEGRLEQPAGLVPYYDVRWNERVLSDKGEGVPLYPAIAEDNTTTEYRYVVATATDFANGITIYTQTSTGGYEVYRGGYNEGTTYHKRVQMQQTNEDGSPKFETCDNGLYVEDTRYVEAENGGFVRERTVSGYEQTSKPIEGIDTYYSDDQGAMPVTPKVADGFYYQDGMKNDYAQVDKNNDAIGAKDEYYTKDNSNNYIKLNGLPFETNNSYCYKTGSVEAPVYESIGSWKTIADALAKASVFYKLNNGEYEQYLPAFNSQTLYYQDANGDYKTTTTMIEGVSNYYWQQTDGQGNVTYTNANNAQLDGTEVFYNTGRTEQKNTYSERQNYFVPGKEWFIVDVNTGNHTAVTLSWWNNIANQDYYYVTGQSPNIVTAQNTDYNSATTYYTDVAGTTEATEVTFYQSYYYPVYNDTYRAYTDADGDATQYKLETYYREATTADGSAPRYCPVMEDVEFNPVTVKNDYRGWHQFVLNAYSKGTDIPMQPKRSYETDNDWWTICLPYDLTYNEVMLFYGDVNETGQPDDSKVPIVCLLSNVVRDKENNHIRLNFSSNLMEHKATKVDGEWIVSADKAPNHDKSADADVIIHKGVPYAIKPMFKAGAGRQFDVYGRESVNAQISQGRITANSVDYPGLYEKLKAAEDIAGEDFRNMQEDNLYTVPALIPVSQATDDEVVDKTEITYEGEKYYRLNSIDYTFVGALQLNVIPPFSYFLGYKNSSLFVYADYDTQEFEENKKSTTPDYRNTFKWTNNACVICPNLLSESCKDTQKGENNKYNLMKGSHDGKLEVADATSGARWEIFNKQDNIGLMSMLTDDRFTQSSSSSRGIFAQGCEIHYGFDMTFPMVDGIKNLDSDEAKDTANGGQRVYSLDGQYMGTSRQGLKKGVYIIGGRKYVVK